MGQLAQVTLKKLTFKSPAITSREAADKPIADVMCPWSKYGDLPVKHTDVITGHHIAIARMCITVKKATGSALIMGLESPHRVVYSLRITHLARYDLTNRPLKEAINILHRECEETLLHS
jgi:hypothetical protein